MALLMRTLAGPVNDDYNATLLPWAVAIGLYLFAVPPALHRPAQPGALSRRSGADALTGGYRRQVVVLAGAPRSGRRVRRRDGPAGAGATGVGPWADSPQTLGGDEGSQGLEAFKVLEGTIRNPFSTGWLGVPTLSFYFNAPSIALFGNTIFALRFPWALVGAATILVTFLLVSRLKGPGLGLLTAALLTTYHFHIHFSRLGSNQVADPLFVALALLLLYRGYDRRRALDWALCGVVVGLAQYSYAGARFTAIIVAACVLVLAVRDRLCGRPLQVGGALSLLGAALLTAAPMIQHALRFPADYNARLNHVGIVQSGWLTAEAIKRHQPAWQILLDQLQRAALAFNVYPDRTMWYGSPGPCSTSSPRCCSCWGWATPPCAWRTCASSRWWPGGGGRCSWVGP